MVRKVHILLRSGASGLRGGDDRILGEACIVMDKNLDAAKRTVTFGVGRGGGGVHDEHPANIKARPPCARKEADFKKFVMHRLGVCKNGEIGKPRKRGG